MTKGNSETFFYFDLTSLILSVTIKLPADLGAAKSAKSPLHPQNFHPKSLTVKEVLCKLSFFYLCLVLLSFQGLKQPPKVRLCFYATHHFTTTKGNYYWSYIQFVLNVSMVLVIGLFSVEICPKNMIFLADCVSCLWHSYWNLYLFKAEETQERSQTTGQLIKILFNFCSILVTTVDESMEGLNNYPL